MGKFKTFIQRYMGKDTKGLYEYLVENAYNNFENFVLCTDFDGPPESHPQIASRMLRQKLATLKEFVQSGGDYNNANLSFEEIHQQCLRAKRKNCLISELNAGVAKDEKSKETSQLLFLLRTMLISQLNPYEVISQSHFSKEDSEEARNASIAYYGLESEKHCQILGPRQQQHVAIVNAHIWPWHKSELLPVWGVETSCIHDPKNVLRLQKDIERAFDTRLVTFLESSDHGDGGFELKVLSPDVMTTTLKGTSITFNDLNGRPLLLPSGKFPYRMFLANHAVLAYKHAREKGWTTQDLSEIEVKAEALLAHSLDEEAQQRLALLWT